MKKMLRPFALVLGTVIAASPLAAQEKEGVGGVSGTWITEIERSLRNENGVVSGGEKAKAKIVLEQKGDSVTGTLQLLDSPEGRPATPRQLRGTVSGSKVALSTEVEATVNFNGELSTRKMSVTYDLLLDGDRLEGTITNRSGDREMAPRPFFAWRDKT